MNVLIKLSHGITTDPRWKRIMKFMLQLTITFLLSAYIMPHPDSIFAGSVLILTVDTDKESYYIREPVVISGSVLERGEPCTDCLISIEVRNPKDNPLLYRTIPIGSPSQRWLAKVRNIHFKDLNGNITDTVIVNSLTQLCASIQNTMARSLDMIVTATILDDTSIPIFSGRFMVSIRPEGSINISWTVYIPEWASPGNAQAFINVYSDLPKYGGIPYTPETTHTVYIARNAELQHLHPVLPSTYTSQPGEYRTTFRTSPDRYSLPGNYSIYVTATSEPSFRASDSTLFRLDSYPSPPQAAFTYHPLEIFANMTVTFDASSSSAEGFNDAIICYEWHINDPNNPQVIVNTGNYTDPPDPTVEHAFIWSGTYIVELNVTDNEGLWSKTSKPVNVLPEYDPTANFTWTPTKPYVDWTVSFDASSCMLGWSAQIADYSPIIEYRWNFSDGTTINLTDPIMNHTFTDSRNFTVTLTVIDSVGREDITSKTVEVRTRPYDVAEPYGKIDMRDVALVARAFGTEEGDHDWNPTADITGPDDRPDGKVDMRDVGLVAIHFGEEY